MTCDFFRANPLFQLRQQIRQQLAQVARDLADAGGLGGVGRLVFEQMAVVFDHDTAAGGIHHQRFDATFNMRPPSVDIAAHLGFAAVMVVQVKFDRAAAAGLDGQHHFDTGGVQHAGGGAVDVGLHGGLHATGQHEHFAGVLSRRPSPGRLRCWHLVFERLGQQPTHRLTELHSGCKQRRRQALFQRPAQGFFSHRALYAFIHQLAADIDQMTVVDTARASGFAVAAGQATVQVELGFARRHVAFEHLFDEVNAAPRAVQLVTQQLVRWAGGGTKTAVHAFAQNGFSGQAVRRALKFRGEIGLHGKLCEKRE